MSDDEITDDEKRLEECQDSRVVSDVFPQGTESHLDGPASKEPASDGEVSRQVRCYPTLERRLTGRWFAACSSQKFEQLSNATNKEPTLGEVLVAFPIEQELQNVATFEKFRSLDNN